MKIKSAVGMMMVIGTVCMVTLASQTRDVPILLCGVMCLMVNGMTILRIETERERKKEKERRTAAAIRTSMEREADARAKLARWDDYFRG